ncbi:MAG: hypothetical protein V3W41_19985 [Planctomycetota bacterium]
MRSLHCLSILLVILTVGACTQTGPKGQTGVIPEGYSLRNPRSTTDIFKWAIETKQPEFAYLCLSRSFVTENKVTPGAFDLFFGIIEDEITKKVGKISDIIITKQEKIGDRRARITFESGEHVAICLFVLETDYEVEFRSRRLSSVGGTTDDISKVMRVEENRVIIELPLDEDRFSADATYQVRVNNFWKFAGVIESNLEDLNEKYGDPEAKNVKDEAVPEVEEEDEEPAVP